MLPLIHSTYAVFLTTACALGGESPQVVPQKKPTTISAPLPTGKSPESNGSTKKDSTNDQHRFLLLNTGRVIEGNIVQDAGGGFVLRRASASVRYEDSMVVALADSLEELYEIKVKLVPPNDVQERFKIADWCLANKLNDLARKELEEILKVDPGNGIAQRKYRRLTKPESSTERSTVKKKPERPLPAVTEPLQVIADFRAAHGQPAFEHFRMVESMLINRCGSAGCHGSPRYEGEFKLIKPREGNLTDSRMTARNLQSILNAVDLRQPAQSPILTMALESKNHGPRGLPPLAGINDPLFQDLKDWVFNYATSSMVERARPETPSRKRMNARNRSYAGTAGPSIVHPLWTTESGPRGRLVLDDGTVREFGTPAGASNTQSVVRSGNRNQGGNMAGDDVARNRPGFGSQTADDSPPAVPAAKSNKLDAKPQASAKPGSVPTSAPTAPATTKAGDPNDPSQFNSQPEPTSSGAKSQEKYNAKRQNGRSAVPKGAQLSTDKRGQMFDAAPGPINGRQPQ